MLTSRPVIYGVLASLLAIAALTNVLAWRANNPQLDTSSAITSKTPLNGEAVAASPVPGPAPAAAPAAFVDVTKQAGISYQWTIPGPRPLDILQTIGNGCAFLDYNNDGNLDILLVGPTLAMYRGDGHGHFTDVTHEIGLDQFKGHFLGCAVGDYDNDGFDDIYISGYRTGLLLHNEAGKTFRDVTAESGLKAQPWGTSCAWADLTGTGRLDLYVGNYVAFDPAKDKRICGVSARELPCGPETYRPEFGTLYHNLGNGRFQDVSAQWHSRGSGKVLGAAFADYNHSGRPSLYLANDEVKGNLLQNGSASFKDVGSLSGTAADAQGRAHAGMGTDWGDYDNDGRLDLSVMTYRHEPKCVYRNMGAGIFRESSSELNITERTLPYVSFGTKWLDYDNDGWLDLMITNGHADDSPARVDPTATFREPSQLFWNSHGKTLIEMSAFAGSALSKPIVGRGLAIGDFDNDGRVDALLVDSDGNPELLRNESPKTGHWITFDLLGTHCNRDGYGAEVTVATKILTQTRVCHTDGSYLSSSDKRVHVGVGKSRTAERVIIRWPDGHRDVYRHVPADKEYTALEGSPTLKPR